MSKLHSEIMQELSDRNITVNTVKFMLVGLNDEIIAEYDFGKLDLNSDIPARKI